MHMLQTHSPAIFSVIGFFLVSFGPFSTVHSNTIRMRFHFDPLSRVFSNGCVFDEIALRTEGLNESNVRVFKQKRISVDRAI